VKREFNSPDEMFKRLIYVLYVGCVFFGFLSGVMGILGGRVDALMVTGILVPLAVILKSEGVKRLEFRRLAESFPMGCAEDALDNRVRQRFQLLIGAFTATDNWMTRQEIRREMGHLTRKHPLLLSVFEQEIEKVHPTLLFSRENRGSGSNFN
jgi:hypothetical protein